MSNFFNKMAYLYQDDPFLKDDDSINPNSDENEDEGPLVPEEDFEEDEDEENEEDSY